MLSINDKVCKFRWTVPTNNNFAQTVSVSIEIILKTSTKHNTIEADDGKEFSGEIFTDIIEKNFMKRYSRI